MSKLKGESVMKNSIHLKKALKLVFILFAIVLLGPVMLGKLNFYGDSHAKVQQPSESDNVQMPLHQVVSYADAVAKAAPAVVSIQTTKEIPMDMHPLMQDPFFRYFFGDPNLQQGNSGSNGLPPKNSELQKGLGSGVIVDKRGYVLTNNHVIKDTNSIVVKLQDGRTSEAKVVGHDSATDIAVLKINLKNLPIIEVGDSTKLRVGDVVLAIGNPFGLDRTVTQGIVSATGALSVRSNDQIAFGNGMLDNLIQTDAAINPGNSGGALIDAYGKLIGINMAIISHSGGHQGIGFAIPMDTAKNVMTQLIETGHIVRGWLGTQLRPIDDDMRKYLEISEKEGGVYVAATVRHSPAQQAGILPGDVIIKINNEKIKNIHRAVQLAGDLKPEQAYPIEVFRKGEYLTFSVRIKQRPENT